MRRFYCLFAFLLTIGIFHKPSFAQDDKVLMARRIKEDIIIDGVIDRAWATADSACNFFQLRPHFNQPPSRTTCAKLLTGEKALYCLIRCEDERKNIQRTTGKLDDFGGDVVSLMIDTFGDKRTAYKFAVSASGVRMDCRLLDDARNRDYSWDGVWFAAAKIYDTGYVIEMEIPYRSIQYDEKLMAWGLDFDRWIPAEVEDLYWCSYAENEGQRISKFGKLIFNPAPPTVKGLTLEVFPVGLAKTQYQGGGAYHTDPTAGIDIFYNPSQRLTFQLTANPDFAQIEADPYEFNISRYESYFSERRPFFTQGNEIFMPSGKQSNSGFYRPLELFYSRRIGRKLPDGGEVPLLVGSKAFGRIGEWEYGGFLAKTGEKTYTDDDGKEIEPSANFTSLRFKRQILHNSDIGLLYVGKNTAVENSGVIDIDGAFRKSDWQLSYQLARSYQGSNGDYAGSFGLIADKEKWLTGIRGRYIGKDFDIQQVGYVPWLGTGELVVLTGPRKFYKSGAVQTIALYSGFGLGYERVDHYTDRIGLIGFNMQFRSNWGYEIDVTGGRSKDQSIKYNSMEVDFSSWFSISPRWSANLNGGYAKTYNFSRDYLSFYSWTEAQISWQAIAQLYIGSSLSAFIEGNPQNQIEEITYNARPYVSLTPVNNLNIRVYWDALLMRSRDRLEGTIGGFLFSYNFRPKSWIYLAINEVRNRNEEYDAADRLILTPLRVLDRVSVVKLKYLFYF